MVQAKEIEKILGTDKYNKFFVGLTKYFNVAIYHSPSSSEDYAFVSGDVYASSFTSPSRLAFAYFHELGHKHIRHPHLNYSYDTLVRELACWNKSLELASSVGVFFDDETIKYGYELALTYAGQDEKEYRKWKDLSTDFSKEFGWT